MKREKRLIFRQLLSVLCLSMIVFAAHSQETQEEPSFKAYGVDEAGKYIVRNNPDRGAIADGAAYVLVHYYIEPGEQYTLSVKGNSSASSVSMLAAWYTSEDLSKETYLSPAVYNGGTNPMATKYSDGTHELTAPANGVVLGVTRMKDATVILYHDDKIVHILQPGMEIHDPADYLSGTLPVMYITTEDSVPITSKEYYLDGTYYFDNMGHEDVESIGSEDNQLALQIKGRGNASWRFEDKKPYRIKLDKKQGLMGLKKNKHFCLMAHAEDANAYQRDEIGFTLSSLMELEWTPQQRPIELVVNGDYVGIYWVAEKIRVEKDRVNVVEQKDNETDPEKITGGWLIEIDNYAEDGQVIIPDGNGTRIRFTMHTPEVLSPEQREYITNFLTTTNEMIYVEDKNDTRWEDYIDIDELAKFYVLMEAVDNCESFSGSCYWHKELGSDTKLVVGPVWDFGSVASHWRADSFNYFIYQETQDYVTSHWIEEIAKFPRFQQKARAIWRQIYPSLLEEVHQHCLEYVDYITPAIKSDYKRWNNAKSSSIAYRKVRVWQMLASKWAFLAREWKEDIPTAISDINADVESSVIAVRYFDLAGREIKSVDDYRGILIKQSITSDGKIVSSKIIK